MRNLVLSLNYIFLFFSILITWDTIFNYKKVPHPIVWIIMVLVLLVYIILNLIYIHRTKPVDTEKENMKKQIKELNKKVEIL